MVHISEHRTLRQVDLEFQDSLAYIMRPVSNKQERRRRREGEKRGRKEGGKISTSLNNESLEQPREHHYQLPEKPDHGKLLLLKQVGQASRISTKHSLHE